MKSKLKRLSEVVANANDALYAKFSDIDTLMGIMDQTLRKQGINADAITIDCIPANKKIVLLLDDGQPEQVEIAIGNKAGDIYSSSHFDLSEVTEGMLLALMEANFIQKN
jgi:hypothetical protein